MYITFTCSYLTPFFLENFFSSLNTVKRVLSCTRSACKFKGF